MKKDTQIQLTLSSKLLIGVILISLLLTLLSVTIQFRREYNEGMKEVDNIFKQIEQSYLESLTLSIWNFADDQMEKNIDGILGLPFISEVTIIKNIGEPYKKGKEIIGRNLSRDFKLQYIEQDQSVHYLGTLQVIASLKQFDDKLVQMAIEIFLFEAIKVLILSLLILVLVNKIVTRHIIKVTDFFSKFDSNNNFQPLIVSRKFEPFSKKQDEITIMIDAINILTKDLHDYTNNLKNIIDAKTRNIRSILENIRQGILIINEEARVEKEFSRTLPSILEKSEDQIINKNIIELLFKESNLNEDSKAIIGAGLTTVLGEDGFSFEINEDVFPREITYDASNSNHKIFEIDWSPIINKKDKIEKLLVSIRDVTKFRQVQHEAAKNAKHVKRIGELIGIDDNKLATFFISAQEYLSNVQSELSESTINESNLRDIFINYHTLKGLARSYDLSFLADKIHCAETNLDFKNTADTAAMINKNLLQNDLEECKNELNTYQRIAIRELKKIVENMHGGKQYFKFSIAAQNYLAIIDKFRTWQNNSNEKISSELRKDICSILGENLEELVMSIVNSSESIAKKLGKPAIKFRYSATSLFFTKKTDISWVSGIFTHLVRNSIDHGIETIDERRRSGKNMDATIYLNIYTNNEKIILEFYDDGKGINLEKLKKKAIEQRIILSNKISDDKDLLNLIFLDGFSTANQVTEISGRGIGMHAVRKILQDHGGDIILEASGSKIDSFVPIKFKILLPITSFLA